MNREKRVIYDLDDILAIRIRCNNNQCGQEHLIAWKWSGVCASQLPVRACKRGASLAKTRTSCACSKR